MHYRPLYREPKPEFATKSRAHPLKQSNLSNISLIKRDDELSLSLSGSKVRKYSSLLPKLEQLGVKEVLLMGGAYSNHILSAAQLFIQRGITPHLLLVGRPNTEPKGNFLYTKLLVPDEQISWLSRDQWKTRHLVAARWKKAKGGRFVIEEGGSCKESIMGALTLPLDILNNEEELSCRFDQIFIEAGTGMMAAATALYLNSINHRAKVHILLLADEEESFKRRVNNYRLWMAEAVGQTIPKPKNIILHRPSTLKSFGATSPKLFCFIKDFAQKQGILLDPIYSAKLFLEKKQWEKEGLLQGLSLFIHSGGVQTLAGFQEQLQACLQKRS